MSIGHFVPRLLAKFVLDLYKAFLAPILLAQAAWLRRKAMRLPEAAGPRSGLLTGRSGEPPIRLLFFGDSSAAGVGVAHQDHALAYPCAAILQHRTGRSVQWRLLAKSGLSTEEASGLLEQNPVGPAEVIITVIGVNDVTSQKRPKQFLTAYQTLVRQLQAQTGASVGVINGIPQMETFPAIPNPLRWYLGICARRLDAQLHAWTATQPKLRFVSLQRSVEPSALATDGLHPGPKQYRQWAERIAQNIEELLGLPTA